MSSAIGNDAPTDRYVTIEGVRIRYWEGGEGERSVVLVHGVGSYVERWRRVFELLGRRFRVYAIDLPGRGLSDKPAAFSYHVTSLARFVRLFANTVGIAPYGLVGSSLGGAVVAHYARLFPERVERLVLSSSAGWGRGVTPALRVAGLPGIGELLGGRQSRRSSRLLLQLIVANRGVVTEEVVDLHYRMSTQPGAWCAFLRLLRANGNLLGQSRSVYGPLRRELRDFRKPVLILWGDRDRVIPPAHARVAASVLPHAEVRVLEGGGHLLMLDRAEEYACLVSGFLERGLTGTR